MTTLASAHIVKRAAHPGRLAWRRPGAEIVHEDPLQRAADVDEASGIPENITPSSRKGSFSDRW